MKQSYDPATHLFTRARSLSLQELDLLAEAYPCTAGRTFRDMKPIPQEEEDAFAELVNLGLMFLEVKGYRYWTLTQVGSEVAWMEIQHRKGKPWESTWLK